MLADSASRAAKAATPTARRSGRRSRRKYGPTINMTAVTTPPAVNAMSAACNTPRLRGGSGNEYASQATHSETHTVDSENSGDNIAAEW